MITRSPIRVERITDLVEGRARKGPKPRGFVTRFWESFQKGNPDECWEWKGEIASHGYGVLSICNWPYLAHRISYLIHHGTIDPDRMVMHSCDNPKCVNPNHLSLGTGSDNTRDAVSKGRMLVGELNGGHKLREQDVRWIRLQYGNNGWTVTRLAEIFGVWPACISRIIKRQRWNHIC